MIHMKSEVLFSMQNNFQKFQNMVCYNFGQCFNEYLLPLLFFEYSDKMIKNEDNIISPDQTACGHRLVWEYTSITEKLYSLTQVLLNPDIPCFCKQCRSKSVGF